ncbi:hypothetical protein NQ317_004930 [Molorchus minor]|uniref:Uncharacterized protein n=1 Tax=Molorchus minor TaxID=1323400 RepID=A0ABQ9JUB0_9CUCU|nr:hypothetical protein NQ317_004930 [Molorchus minor]
MQKELEMLRKENAEMKKKISNEAQIVPNLVENIISDKNIDIEKLRDKLNESEKLLEAYTSLNLDRREIQALSNLKRSGTSIEEVLSIIELSSSSEPEISKIEKVGPPNVHYTINAPLGKPNSTEILKPSAKHVRFEDSVDVGQLTNNKKLQLALEETEKALANATETFEREQQELRDREQDLGVQLAEAKLHLSEKEKRINVLDRDSVRKDEMYMKLAKREKGTRKGIDGSR